MDAQKFNHNIAIIESLNVSFYEKDLIRSAYYNHINNIPVSREASGILNKYFIVFRNGEIVFRNGNVARAYNKKQEIENRKKMYRQSLQEKATKNSVYAKDFLQEKIAPDTKSSLINDALQNGEVTYNSGIEILKECENVINDSTWLTKEELTYKKLEGDIANIKRNLELSIKALNEFLSRFVSFFDGLPDNTQKEILQKGNDFLQELEQEKNSSASLLVTISALKARHTNDKGKISQESIQNSIKSLEAYSKKE